MRPLLLLLGLVTLFALTPVKLFAQPAACLAAANLVNTPDFAASPRPDRHAELLALLYTNGLVAAGPLYDRIHLDLELAALQFPELDLWDVHRGKESKDGVRVTFVDEEAFSEAENGANEAFNCLTEILDVNNLTFWSSINGAYVGFDGLYDIPPVLSLFELIPEIDLTLPDYSIVANFDTGCFHSPDGFRRVYFLEEVIYDYYPAVGTGNVERIDVEADGSVTYEEYDNRYEAPWQAELETCLSRQLSGDLDPSVVPPPLTACSPGGNVLCLDNERFEVRVEWTDFQDFSGPGITIAEQPANNSGIFYFFSPDNWELMVKVLDGCEINDRYWVFAAATTNVAYELVVEDTSTATIATYSNPLGVASAAITDTDAFDTCP